MLRLRRPPGSGQSVIPFVGRVRRLRRWYTALSGDQNQGCGRLTRQRPNARSISGLPRIGPAAATLYHHTVAPNWAVRLAGPTPGAAFTVPVLPAVKLRVPLCYPKGNRRMSVTSPDRRTLMRLALGSAAMA